MPSQSDVNAAIALTRFGLGARPGEIQRLNDPRGWLEGQIQPSGAANPTGQFDTSVERMQAFLDYQRDARQVRQARQDMPPAAGAQPATETPAEPRRPGRRAQRMAAPAQAAPQTMPMAPQAMAPAASDPAQAAFDARRDSRRDLVQDTAREFLARAQLGAATEAGFAERWALFWANGFTVSATKFQSAVFMGQYEREAIRPHVFGKFEDLAVAAEQHPAMLLYLDQAQSIGPDSRAGQRRNAGLNENLAREIMELHTVGADGGYTQADVTEFARALTGWSVPAPRDQGMDLVRANVAAGAQGFGGGGARQQARYARGVQAAVRGEPGLNGFVYRAIVHEPGERTVLGKTYAPGEKDQGEAILRDLANSPRTTRRLARRIAAHFVADDPPPALVDRLEQAWTRSGGDLAVVARALITAPESWEPRPAKIKTPYEFIISAHRALGTAPQRIQPLQQALVSMGQPAFAAPSPEGWPDTAADWAGPDALVKRLDWSKAAADLAQVADPNTVAANALGARLGERTRLAVARAESRPEALTLFLMSPEFQRR
ncbi:DUF1800 domain-containing protein [Brevundimonas goettingensis]|uniref:DUF1800 family protein n=1 Tax=Brevundimonas goettingensis TaxID=2774190 RepID=A0A975GVL2_9CAUL|nr:DUF1800 family protein [Brevundimonas goettingensis]QTC90773.1 DUF1800 family protein [Brevundimonas goettingensis]